MANIDDCVDVAYHAGFRGNNLVTAVAIAGAESGYDKLQITSTPFEQSIGLWQINVKANAHPEYDQQSLLDPSYNARAAFSISNAGSSWQPWSTYPVLYLAFLPRAQVAVAAYLAKQGGNTANDTATQGTGTITAAGVDCLNNCNTKYPPANDTSDSSNYDNRQACLNGCLGQGTSIFGGTGGGAQQTAQDITLPCRQCSITDIPACFACMAAYFTKGLVSIGINILLVIAVLVGIYLLFKPEIDNHIKTVADNAKKAATIAAEVA